MVIIDSDESIVQEVRLNRGRFESYISVGLKKQEILTAFNVESEEMNNWCSENYGMNFDAAYEMIRQIIRGEYLDAMKDLGFKGNPTAISIIDRFINVEDTGANNKMVFNVNVNVEKDDDKRCE